MLYTYKECIEKYGSDYMLKKAISAGKLFMLQKGLYSDDNNVIEMEVILTKYNKAVLTGESAYYYYGLTDVIPDKYVLATKRTDTRITSPDIKQVFIKDELFKFGKTQKEYKGINICIYSLERLLVDLIRSKSKVPFDYYKEIIANYRRIAETLDFYLVEEYASMFRTKNSIMRAIQLEVL